MMMMMMMIIVDSKTLSWGIFHIVVIKILDLNILVSDFELQLCYFVHFLEEVMRLLILWGYYYCFSYKDNFSFK